MAVRYADRGARPKGASQACPNNNRALCNKRVHKAAKLEDAVVSLRATPQDILRRAGKETFGDLVKVQAE